MSESGVDLDFDLLSPDGFDSQGEGEAFYKLKSKALDFSRYGFYKEICFSKSFIHADLQFCC